LLKHVNYVNYIIRPNHARPTKSYSLAYSDVYDFDLDQVEMAALRETLQTTLGPNPFSAFIRSFLVPYSAWLKWLGEGPGIGREMRRAFSGLFGRFFARAYLSDCHRLVWFTPLDGRLQDVAPRLQVRSSKRGNFFPIGYVPVKMVWRSLKRKVPGVAVILVITLSRHPSSKQRSN
jgi:hypothetical protein